MKKLATIFVVALGITTAMLPSVASAAEHNNIGLGFHSSDAPVGVRFWLEGQKLAIDAGVGFASEDAGDETLTRFTIEGGVPIVLKSWERVHTMFRPGLSFTSQDVFVGKGETDSATMFRVLAELEVEVFLVSNVSVSASHGLAIENTSPPGDGDSSTDFGLFGRDFTEVGFHVYLFGEN